MSDAKKKPTAFVIQSFDGGSFDKRYAETIRPALVRAGAEPQRADQILGLQPIIQKIEKAIREASICVAEVSLDNPNVWLELGYALSLDRPTVILCDRHLRDRLPFDIQHRPVIFYSTDSKSGYEDLEEKIVAEVINQLATESRVAAIPVLQDGATDTKDMRGYEIAVLAAVIAVWPSAPEGISAYELEKKLARTEYSDVQISIGLAKLIDGDYLERTTNEDRDGNEYFLYKLTTKGMKWLLQNEHSLKPVRRLPSVAAPKKDEGPFPDDDIPF